MIKPPAKRLRILQSVEVDETNPDYVEAKQKQQQKFKSRLEKIFAKYGSMHESMSDEIDFNTGKVVVDRGHIRRVQRQMKQNGPTLVDNFLNSAFERDDASGEEEEQVESEDELAPTQTRKRKRDTTGDGEKAAQSSEQQNITLVTSPPQGAPAALAHENAFQVPNTPNPTANLLQQIQQTPLGPQTQAALIANLNQTIAQAVQQAVAPLLSILQNTPNGQAAQASTFPIPSPRLPATDTVRPAADPKWYFPPISAVREALRIEHQRSSPYIMTEASPQTATRVEISSPLVPRRRSPKVHVQRRRITLKRNQSPQVLEASVERPQSSHSLPALCNTINSYPDADPLVNNTPDCKAKRVRSIRKYHFTEEDDIYISKGRELHNKSFKEIKASKAKWSDWPLSAFYGHWKTHLKGKKLHLQNMPRTGSIEHDTATPAEQDEQFFSSIEIPETSSAEYRPPTPDSLEQDEIHIERAVVPSSSHFDDDELELLSLAGADISDVLSTHTSHYEEDNFPTPDEPLPSIEGAEFRNEDELQLEMLKTEETPTPEPTQAKVLPSTIPETQDSVVIVSSPSQKRATVQKPRPMPVPICRATSDSSDDLDLIGADDEPTTPRVYIKREPSTPQASRILCSSPTYKTPRPVPQSSGMAARSTGKLDRRAYLKEVKKGWAKANGKTPGSQRRTRSFNMVPKMSKGARGDVETGDSEDELAV